jgi:hypothetical protein
LVSLTFLKQFFFVLRFFYFKCGFSQITFFRKVREINIHSKFLKILFCTFWYINQLMLEKNLFFSKNGRSVYLFDRFVYLFGRFVYMFRFRCLKCMGVCLVHTIKTLVHTNGFSPKQLLACAHKRIFVKTNSRLCT